jgi:hypothetical protein
MYTCISLITVFTLSADMPRTLPDVVIVGDYTEGAVKTIEARIKRRSSHEIQSFSALSKDIAKRIQFIEQAANIMKILDAIRTNETAQAFLKNIPGAQWLQMSLTKLSELIRNVEGIHFHLQEMERVSKSLTEAINQHFLKNRGDPTKLHELLEIIRRANGTFQDTARAFSDSETLLGGVSIVLGNCKNVVAKTTGVPLLGSLTKPLHDQLKTTIQGVQIAKAILKTGQQAVKRTQLEIKEVQQILANAMAHDTYNAAEIAQAQGKPGSALLRFYQVRTYWTDTPWAHRADQRITDAIAEINTQAEERMRLAEQVASLQGTVAQLQDDLNDRTSNVTQLESDLSSATSMLKWTGIGLVLLVLGLLYLIIQYRTQHPSPNEDESTVPAS